MQVDPDQEQQRQRPAPWRPAQQKVDQQAVHQQRIEVRTDIDKRCCHRGSNRGGDERGDGVTGFTLQRALQQAEGGNHHQPLPVNDAGQAKSGHPGIVDNVCQPLMVQPILAMTRK